MFSEPEGSNETISSEESALLSQYKQLLSSSPNKVTENVRFEFSELLYFVRTGEISEEIKQRIANFLEI